MNWMKGQTVLSSILLMVQLTDKVKCTVNVKFSILVGRAEYSLNGEKLQESECPRR